jgi:hypothetical protein
MKNKESEIISQSKAASDAGISRQAINGMFKKGVSQFRFFTDDGKVNSSHPDWLTYLDERRTKSNGGGSRSVKNNPQPHNDRQRGDELGKQKRGRDDKPQPAAGWSREHALTGGFDPSQFVPTNTSQLKSLTDIVARNLEIRMKLGDLIPRSMVDLYIDRIGQGLNQFVSLGRSVSSDICEKLDRVGMEREIEKMINPKVKAIIEQIIESCNNAKK